MGTVHSTLASVATIDWWLVMAVWKGISQKDCVSMNFTANDLCIAAISSYPGPPYLSET